MGSPLLVLKERKALRRKRKQNGIQSNGDKLLIAFWFISGLIILIPAILIAIFFVEQYFI